MFDLLALQRPEAEERERKAGASLLAFVYRKRLPLAELQSSCREAQGVIIRLAVNGNTLRLCLGLWGVLGNFFFFFQPPVKIFGDAVVWTLPFSPHAHSLSPLDLYAVAFISLPSGPNSLSVVLAAPVVPLL